MLPDDPYPHFMITTTTAENIEEMMHAYASAQFYEQMVSKLADRYIADYGDQILARIQNQTIDAKVIQKVIANLRKELTEKK